MTTPLSLTVRTSVGDVPLHAEARGTGAAVLVLHGGAGPASVTAFADLLAEATGTRVVTPVHPGFGGTPRPDGLSTMAGLAEVYEHLLEALDLADVTVVGNSIGGWITAELALRHSPRVSRIALVDAVGVRVDGHPQVDFDTLTPADLVRRSWYDPSRAPALDPSTLPPAAREILLTNRQALAAYGGTGADPSLLARLGGIDVPALVLWGEADGIVDPGYGRALAAAIPSARFQLLPRTGHVPQLESPRALLTALTPFVGA